MGMPSSLTSSLRAIMHPSLLDNTATGKPFSVGSTILSHEAKKLLQSNKAIQVGINDMAGLGCIVPHILHLLGTLPAPTKGSQSSKIGHLSGKQSTI